MKGNNKCCSRILPHAGKWKPYLCSRFRQVAYSMRLPCDPIGVWLHSRTLAQHTHGLGLYPHHHKNRKRDTQQHGTINFSCHLVSNCYDFQRNSLLTNLKPIRRCEEAMEHVGPSPGKGLWCPLMGMPEHKQARTTNSEFTVWYTRGSKCKVATRGGAVTNAEVPQASSHTESSKGSKFKT